MSYDKLSHPQQKMVDAIMNGARVTAMAKRFKVSEDNMKRSRAAIYHTYGIDTSNKSRFVPAVRLAFLRAKELGMIVMCVVALALTCSAQAATRSVALSWAASTSSSVTGYNVYRCSPVAPNVSCTPSTTGAPLATVTGLSYTDTANTQAYYGYAVVAVAPACTGTSSITSPCGGSAAANLVSVPVPPQVDGAHNMIAVVP